MKESIMRLGAVSIRACQQLGESYLFLAAVLCKWPRWRQLWPLLSEQLYRLGVLSLVIVLLSALFIGMVIALQGYTILEKFGATTELGQMVALSILRELGPVITALLFVGRACSSMTAEIGLMRATNQLDCLEVMSVDPLWRIIAPRFWAGLLALPLLTLLFNVVAIYGGVLVGVDWLGVDAGSYWSNMQSAVDFGSDVVNGMIKSMVFAVLVTHVAVYQGYHAAPNSLGISRATTKTVVYSSLLILVMDFILTALMMKRW